MSIKKYDLNQLKKGRAGSSSKFTPGNPTKGNLIPGVNIYPG